LQGSIEKPPEIDEHNIRLVQLSAGGEPFKKWVFSIVQDNYGFVWLGTDDGLYRYDGYTLKAYRQDPNNPQSLSDNTVTTLYKDRAGALWIGTAYGGLNKLDITQNTFTHYQHDTKTAGA
jgi:ligand-binding sensor domain-containing protein